MALHFLPKFNEVYFISFAWYTNYTKITVSYRLKNVRESTNGCRKNEEIKGNDDTKGQRKWSMENICEDKTKEKKINIQKKKTDWQPHITKGDM